MIAVLLQLLLYYCLTVPVPYPRINSPQHSINNYPHLSLRRGGCPADTVDVGLPGYRGGGRRRESFIPVINAVQLPQSVA